MREYAHERWLDALKHNGIYEAYNYAELVSNRCRRRVHHHPLLGVRYRRWIQLHPFISSLNKEKQMGGDGQRKGPT
ncbi:hypothetical protein SAY86_000366 [Trapa natans]|uniref:Uncharacterized protein n=1 Tax=Trapa natans TaxID=22666 RepID=A0AAN7N1A3_TRANT|nr:hypothetical protein SAY86_000366 [Trapa natans]